MTFNAPISISTIFHRRLLIFEFFLQYCNAYNTYNEQQAMWKRIEAYSNLISEWEYNDWDTNEVDQVCSKINSGAQEVNPNLFFFLKRARLY